MERDTPQPAMPKGGFLSRSETPIHVVSFKTPEFSGPRPLLSFILKVLAGTDRKMVRNHLELYLYNDFQFRTPEEDRTPEMCAALEIMQARPEVLDYAVNQMIATMRELSDMWIDSGKSPADPDVDTPSDRNTEDVLPEHGTSLFRLMCSGLFDRFPPRMGMRRDGTQGPITGGEPHFERTDLMRELQTARETLPRPGNPDADLLFALIAALKAFACRWAMFWFAGLLNSPYSRRLSRCDHCHEYFAYERARLRTVKHGVFCPKCAPVDSVKRTERSRKKRLDTAAKAWIEWESKQRRTDQRDWVAEQANKAHGTAFGRRWVSQHLTEIQERVEALRNAKG